MSLTENELIFHAEFDEQSGTLVTDSSPNRFDGVMTPGNHASDTAADGSIGLVFNGTDDYVAFDSEVPTTGNDPFTLMVELQVDGGDGTRRVFFETKSAFSISFEIGTSRELIGYMQLAGSDLSNVLSDPMFVLNLGQKYNVALVYDGRRFLLYADGIQVQSSLPQSGALEAYTGFNIGTFRNANDRWFNGKIYDVRMYKGALDAVDIAEYGTDPADLVDYAIVGAPTTAGAIVAAKVKTIADTTLVVSKNGSIITEASAVTPDSDSRVKLPLTGLEANQEYTAYVKQGRLVDRSNEIKFRTLPTGAASFTVAAATCANGYKYGGSSSQTSNHPIFCKIAEKKPLLFMHQGDLHYRDIETNDQSLFRQAYDDVFANGNQRYLYSHVPLAYVYDDHDFGGDDSTSTSPARVAAYTVYRQCIPHYPLPDSEGIYYTWVIGRVRFIQLDVRTYKDTATMVGATQLQWLKDTMIGSTEEVFVIGIGVPWLSFQTDNWRNGSKQAEQRNINDFLQANNFNDKTLFVGGDWHGSAYDDGTNTNFATAPVGNGPANLQAGALDSVESPQSGTYSSGPGIQGGDKYGIIEIKDSGAEIEVISTVYSYDGATDTETELFQYSFTVSNLSGVATYKGSMFS